MVRSVHGTTFYLYWDIGKPREPKAFSGVLLEIRGPGRSQEIRHATSDENGWFRIRHVPERQYRFKTTLNTWQAVVETIIVFRRAPKEKEIRIEMQLSN